jgi:hypothetical protein
MPEQAEIIWLLEGDPSIRWQVKRDLLGESEAAVLQERSLVASRGWGADLLAQQDASGRWAGQLYNHKWISTTYTLQLLRRMGLDPENAQAQLGCRQLFEGGYQEGGAISFSKTVSRIDLGVCALTLSTLAYFGYPDQRLHIMAEYLLDQQALDGSWIPEPGLERLQYIFAGTLLALEALREYQSRYRKHAARGSEAQAKGREFLLQHQLFKTRDTGEIFEQKLARFSFPPRWYYDVLTALDYFQACQAEVDERLVEAIDLLKSKRRVDGTWNLQNRHPGKTYFEMEQVGQSSRWNTLRALRVLNWWHRS